MSEECAHYLLQIQKQWETLKKEAGPEGEAMALKKSASSNGSGEYGHYIPPGGAEAIGELLNSRYMVRSSSIVPVADADDLLTATVRRPRIGRNALQLWSRRFWSLRSTASVQQSSHAAIISNDSPPQYLHDRFVQPRRNDSRLFRRSPSSHRVHGRASLRAYPSGWIPRGRPRRGETERSALEDESSVIFDWRRSFPAHWGWRKRDEGLVEVEGRHAWRRRRGRGGS